MITIETVQTVLKENIIIKNYKELCKLLNEKERAGKSKQLQLEDWKRYFEYKKEGNKFLITKIYNKEIEKVNNRGKGSKLNHSKYIKEIQDILINYIYKHKNIEGYVIVSFSKLINILGLVNNSYTLGNSKKKEISDILNVSLSGVNFFYKESRIEFKNIINRSIKNLENRHIIDKEDKIIICEEIEDIDGKMIKNYRLATISEENIIRDSQYKALEKLGIEEEKELIYLGYSKYREYNKMVFQELKKPIIDEYGCNINPRQYWIYFYKAYMIKYGDIAINSEYEKIYDTKLQLNKKSINRISDIMGINADIETEDKILIDSLIDLEKYDIDLDDKLIEEYQNNKYYYYNKSLAESIESQKYKDMSYQTLEDWKNKDSVNDYEIEIYKMDIKKRKKKKNSN